jgi:hypothetical protein
MSPLGAEVRHDVKVAALAEQPDQINLAWLVAPGGCDGVHRERSISGYGNRRPGS